MLPFPFHLISLLFDGKVVCRSHAAVPAAWKGTWPIYPSWNPTLLQRSNKFDLRYEYDLNCMWKKAFDPSAPTRTYAAEYWWLIRVRAVVSPYLSTKSKILILSLLSSPFVSPLLLCPFLFPLLFRFPMVSNSLAHVVHTAIYPAVATVPP